MKKYNTIINFVEPTMILKRVTVDTFNNSYPLGHNYTAAAYFQPAEFDSGWSADPPNWTIDGKTVTPDTLYKKNQEIGTTLDLYWFNVWYNLAGQTGGLNAPYLNVYKNEETTPITSIQCFSGDPEAEETDNFESGTKVGSITLSNFTSDDTIKIKFEGTLFGVDSNPVTYELTAISNVSDVPRIQLNAVCKRIFEGSLGRREKDPVRFHLDDETEQWFSQITAPEYCFTRSTLYEVLMEIGGTKEVNAVPRLLWNEETNAFDTITFIKQGDSQDEYTLPATVQLTGEEVDQAAEEFCEEFDSYAENMVNTLDATRGSIIEPGTDGYDTLYYLATTSEELTITDNSAISKTSRKMYRVTKLMIKYNNVSADITPYLFEAAEYDNLTSYKGAYPYAKEWALRYAQGDDKITGLCLKAETQTELGNQFTKMAIYNILTRVLGIDINGGSAGIANLSFNITYISINTVRVKQRKPYLDWKGSGTLFYNQGGNVVEADYYGNHLKNRLARIGNPIKRYTFRLQGQVRPPKIGQVFYDEEDGELLYISQVDEERGLTYTLITMWLTRNVNRLYGYTAINSRKRQYAIDERMSVDRHINISENIYIGDEINESDTSMGNLAIRDFMNMFSNPSSTIGAIETACARGMNGNTYINDYWTLHAVTCAAAGNSLYFGFRYKDNYSAGDQSVSLASAKRMVRAVPYADDNGMFDYLDVRLGNVGVTPDIYDLPEYNGTPGSDIVFSATSTHGRIPVYKDSRDIIHVEVQEHFIATRRSIIIGSELAFCNRLIRGTSDTFGVAFLPYRLNEQRETLTIQDSYKAGDLPASAVTISGRKATISARTNTTGAAAKSWVIYNTENNRLVLGENMDIAAGGQTLPFVFNF